MLTTADPAALTAAFAEEADVLARQIVVTAELPAGLDEHQLQRRGDRPDRTQTFTASAYVPVRNAEDIAAEKASRGAPSP